MTRKQRTYPVALLAAGIALASCLLAYLRPELIDRMERMTYDLRVRAANRASPTVATNLGFVWISEQTARRVWDGSLGFRFGLHWPRQVYGRLVHELACQRARAVGFDVIFGELRPDHASVTMADGTQMESDEYFATQMRLASNVVLAITPEVAPPGLLLSNAMAVGDIFADKDPDGVLRRACAFRLYRRWHPAFRQLEADPEYGVDLARVRIEPSQIVLQRDGVEDIRFPLDADGNFDLADFVGDNLPQGMARLAKPFALERVWHMGIVLAAHGLGLDLSRAEVDLAGGRITLRAPDGMERVIPVDKDGCFYIDWCLPFGHPAVTQESLHDLLAQYKSRLEGLDGSVSDRWRDKLVVVGSAAVVGNNLTDRGATPLGSDTLLVSKHWNVANSLITGRFVRRGPFLLEAGILLLSTAVAAAVALRLRAVVASLVMLALGLAYVLLAFIVFTRTRYWIPLALPTGVMLLVHLGLLTCRLVFEQAEQRRVRSIFSTVVSPKIVHELLQAESLSLVGVRREVTVLFADIRGFTELTESSLNPASGGRQHPMTGAETEAWLDAQAREVLATVNLYLGLFADTLIEREGTLDKFIGDCVMAFWGAPTPNPRHAVACVRAAIHAQRLVSELNQTRLAENHRREEENLKRAAAGQAPLPLLPILFLGTGISTGMLTAGLMGSGSKAVVRQGNYTVFGRDVNLASRLEHASGKARIYISASTYQHLRQGDPALAATCVPLPAQRLKGIAEELTAYEVPWEPAANP